MPHQDPKVRAKNFNEVPLGYTEEQVARETSRCLQCKNPTCVPGCPVSVNIPGFIKLLAEGKPVEAAACLAQTNVLPAVCGRVCPQESQCEGACILSRRGQPVSIGALERYAADTAARLEPNPSLPSITPNGKTVAVVGSGPAGLACAGDLAKAGYSVTVFEAFHRPGGVLVYGIPPFRLPRAAVKREIEQVARLGVKFELNRIIGAVFTVDDLLEKMGFKAVFVAVGAGLPILMGIPGENLGGIYTANEYLTRTNLMEAHLFPEFDTPVLRGRHVNVVGGGNVAMDAARTALRLGAETVRLIYRRSRVELPARAEEVRHAEEEGVLFRTLTNPVRYRGDEEGRVREVECQEMDLGEPDASGRRRPIPKPGSSLKFETDMVIVALGTSAHPVLTSTTPGLALNKGKYIEAGSSGRTSKPRVWAGGDIVTGSATVILAMGAGRRAAQDIHAFLSQSNAHWTSAAT